MITFRVLGFQSLLITFLLFVLPFISVAFPFSSSADLHMARFGYIDPLHQLISESDDDNDDDRVIYRRTPYDRLPHSA
jgi:hypothetical protein